jgi:diguanylate cyclase (GGDEF)-like protein
MMIDIDFFKDYNDTYGHNEGDKCLQTIAETLEKSIMRTNDFIARYGGEEFVVVLPNTVKEGACMLAAKFLDAVRNCDIPHTESTVSECVTISIGVTTGIVRHMQTGDDYVVMADELLYLSKREGRNRYSFKEI